MNELAILVVFDSESSDPICPFSKKCSGDLERDVREAYEALECEVDVNDIHETCYSLRHNETFWYNEHFGFEIIYV